MKFILLLLVLGLLHGDMNAQNAPKPMQAEMMRSTSGRGLDSSGFSSTTVPLQKGAVYDVVSRGNGNVVLEVGGQKVMVQPSAVMLREKPATAEAAGPSGFVPGKIVLVSARYTIEGDQPRNVKNALQKLIPQTVVTAPVEIVVSDALSTAAQDQGNGSQTTVVVTSNAALVYTRANARNVLTVKYLFNNQPFTKQVPEGRLLVLP